MPSNRERALRSLYGTSRRDVMKMGGVGALGFLAGCMGSSEEGDSQTGDGDGGDGSSDGGSGDTDSSGGSGEILDRNYGLNYANVQFNQVNLNPFNANSDWGLRYQLHQTLAGANPTHNTANTEYNTTEDQNLFFQAVRDIEFSEDQFRVHFKTPWVWSNGETAGAEDWVVQLELDRYMIPESDRPDEPTIAEYRADGQETLVMDLNPPFNKWALIYETITGYQRLDTYRDGPMAQYHEAFQDATTESEAKDIRNQVVQHTEGMLVGDHPVSGPWIPVNATPSEIKCELNEDHWAAATQGGPLNFRNLTMYNFGDQSPLPAFQQGTLDISGDPLPPGATYPDNVAKVKAVEFGGQGLCLNWTKNDYYADYRVRQALAYVIDRAQVASNTGGESNAADPEPLEKPIPELLSSVAKEYIPDLYEKLKTFERNDENLKEAARLFEEAGLQRDDGQWYKPNGDPFEIPLQSIEVTVGEMETLQQNFSEFGIQSQVSVVDQTTQSQQVSNNEWITYINTWGEFGFPPNNFYALYGPSTMGDDGGPYGEGNSPRELEIPPPGEWDGEPESFNAQKVLQQIEAAESDEENKEIVRQLAWAGHYTQANFPIYNMSSVTPVRLTDKWIYPDFKPDQELVTPDDAVIWGLDSPEIRLTQGNGGGVRANPDWQG